jgi:hypothetical protein
MQVANIVDPVVVPETSDLTQPVTLRAIQFARDHAGGQVGVSLLTTMYHDEEPVIPDGFQAAPDLTRSVLDVVDFSTPRTLVVLADILDSLLEATGSEQLDLHQRRYHTVASLLLRAGRVHRQGRNRSFPSFGSRLSRRSGAVSSRSTGSEASGGL